MLSSNYLVYLYLYLKNTDFVRSPNLRFESSRVFSLPSGQGVGGSRLRKRGGGDMTSFIPKTTYRPSSLRATHFFLHYLLPPPHQHSSPFQSMLASFFFTKVPFRMAQHICFFPNGFLAQKRANLA